MDNITRAIHDELVLSYTQSARVVPTTVAVVAASLRDALGFADEEEVHKAFTKARGVCFFPIPMTKIPCSRIRVARRV